MWNIQRVAGFMVAAVVGGAVMLGTATLTVANEKGKGSGAHKHFKGEVIEKGGGRMSTLLAELRGRLTAKRAQLAS